MSQFRSFSSRIFFLFSFLFFSFLSFSELLLAYAYVDDDDGKKLHSCGGETESEWVKSIH